MPRDLDYDIAIVGGGAAGFFAAIRAAEVADRHPGRVIILEKASQPLGKVLISGGGRCNVTHACFDPAQLVTYYPRGAEALRGPFSRFQPADTIAWFEDHGVPLKTESDGRVFPQSDTSRSITACLLNAAQTAGVETRLNTAIDSIKVETNPMDRSRFHMTLRQTGRTNPDTIVQEEIFADRILLATGGDRTAFSLAESLGHTIIPPVPSLFTFKINDARIESLAGLSVERVTVSLVENVPNPKQKHWLFSQEGPLLITHWGLSGPAILRLSAWGARWLHSKDYKAILRVNWLHQQSQEEVIDKFSEMKATAVQSNQFVANRSAFSQIPLRLWHRLVGASGIQEMEKWTNLSRDKMHRLAVELTRSQFTIQGKGPFKEEFVTCGGICRDEINFKTMESRLVPGLFFAGEIIDIDGLTGGFNFQNAWTTGWLAGNAIAV